MDLTEVKSFLEERLQLVSNKFDQEREKDKGAFDQKVMDAVNSLKSDMQKEFDDTLIEFKGKLEAEQPKKALTFNQAFLKSMKDQKDEISEAVRGARKGQKSAIELKAFNYSDFTGAADFATEFNQSVITSPYEAFHWRSALPMGSVSGEFVKYPKELAPVGGAAVWTTASGLAKPEIEPKLTTYTSEVEWIAGLIKEVPVQMIEDYSFMSSYLGQKGRDELLKAEDLAVQNGSGGISGLLQEAVLYNGAKTIFVEKLIDAAFRQLRSASINGGGYFANRIVISVEDHTNILLQKATGGSEEYNTPSVLNMRPDGTLTVAGIPVYSTTYLPAGQALIGDFRQASFLMRSGPVLRVFDQNADNAEKNLIMMRIEERIGLAVYSQNAFVKLAAHS